MAIRFDEFNRVCVITVEGELCGEDAARMRRTVEDVIGQRRIIRFVADFEKCEFLDSAGLEALAWARRRCEAAGGQLKLSGLDENCRKILEITRLGPRFECHPGLAAALKHAA